MQDEAALKLDTGGEVALEAEEPVLMIAADTPTLEVEATPESAFAVEEPAAELESEAPAAERVVEEKVEQLQAGEDLYPLIVTELLPEEGPPNASFYIKDGAKRAIAYKVYFENNPYIAVKAYIGTRYKNIK